MTGLPFAVVMAAAASSGLPPVEAGRVIWAGRASLNLVPAVFEVREAGPDEAALDRAARAAGWRPSADGGFMLPFRGGAVALRGWTAGGAWLLQGRTDGRSPFIVRVALDGLPVWADAAGEAPGREPAGAPRPAAGRRLLHVAGEGYEAACYRTPAPAPRVLREAVRALRSGGWDAAETAGPGLIASRRGRPDLAWYARSEGGGAVVVVLASERAG